MGRVNHATLNAIETAAIFNRSFNREYKSFEEAVSLVVSNPGITSSGLKPEYLCELRDKLFDQLYPLIKYSSPLQIHFITRSVIESLSDLILDRKVANFDELLRVGFLELLMSSNTVTTGTALDAKLVQVIMENFSADHNGVRVQYKNHEKNLNKCNHDLWRVESKNDESEDEIERSFEMSSIKLK